MPELAEVEYYRKTWARALRGRPVRSARARAGASVYRGADPGLLARLAGARLTASEASGKQMLFRFSGGAWLGVHLGMTGELLVLARGGGGGRHDHLVLETARNALVFRDPRMFGRIRIDFGPEAPAWWAGLAPAVLSREFTREAVAAFLRRRARSPIKAVLLMQERFPGVGNWMADEILWRAAVHPRQPAGSLRPVEIEALWRECRWVCRGALERIAGTGAPAPEARADTVLHPFTPLPKSWLMPHRWEDGGLCPRTGVPLARAEIGGRTTCWSPARQKLRPTRHA